LDKESIYKKTSINTTTAKQQTVGMI